jgi:hypothetical protein
MQTGKSKIKRLTGGIPLFAQVSLTVEPTADFTRVEFACAGAGFSSQGYLESVPPLGYEPWKDGALAGVRFALAVAGVSAAAVVITEIVGVTSDTNPTVVAVAAAHALWNALELNPPLRAVRFLDSQVSSSVGGAPDQLPQL